MRQHTLTTAGVPQRAVMELLGHRDPRMTVRYQHLAPGHLRDAMRALDSALEPPAAAATAWKFVRGDSGTGQKYETRGVL